MQNMIDFLKYENIKKEISLYREELHKGAEEVADFLVERLKRNYESNRPILSYNPNNIWFYYETFVHRSAISSVPEMDYSTTLPYFIEYLLSLIKNKCGFITDHIQFEETPFHVTITDEFIVLSFTINHVDYFKLDVPKLPKPLQEAITKIQTYHEYSEEPYIHDESLWQPDIDLLILQITKSLEDVSDWEIEVIGCKEGKEIISLFNTFDYDKRFFINKQSFGDILYQSRPIPPFDNEPAYLSLRGDVCYNIKDFDPDDIDPESFTNNNHRFNGCLERQIMKTLRESDNPLIKEMMEHFWYLEFNKNCIEISLRKSYDTIAKKQEDNTFLMGVKFVPDEKLFKMAKDITTEKGI